MLDSSRKNEIRKKVSRIISEADKYHFIHATYACQMLIKGIITEFYSEQFLALSAKIKLKTDAGNEIPEDLIEERDRLLMLVKQGRAHIDVDYIDTPTEEEARVIKINNAFVINLPKSLAENVTDQNGDYNRSAVQKIRNLMAHELGHIVLHTDELLKIEGTQGSLLLAEEVKEEEATFFCNTIIDKREERNTKLHSIEK